ncbi:hypothetical protein Hanom_Chr10g00951641 [Helianthus anomalus]
MLCLSLRKKQTAESNFVIDLHPFHQFDYKSEILNHQHLALDHRYLMFLQQNLQEPQEKIGP